MSSSIKSPCVSICKLKTVNNKMLCSGCKRSPSEIRNWIKFSDKEKCEIIKKIKLR